MIDVETINFQKLDGLVPAIIQDNKTKQVLMLGFMNKQALSETIKRQRVVFWSRSKQRLWEKGEESGNTLQVVSIVTDCDDDTLLIEAMPSGPTCHTGAISCFGQGSVEALPEKSDP
jgi:phosphoribosyl-ATP pyrophosphohydrolase/phosphoribosyl-AMP cyclohydrolase